MRAPVARCNGMGATIPLQRRTAAFRDMENQFWFLVFFMAPIETRKTREAFPN
jgi:hypothetical protein